MIPDIGMTELIVVLVLILLLFGARRIPELARGMGSGVRELRNSVSDAETEWTAGEELE